MEVAKLANVVQVADIVGFKNARNIRDYLTARIRMVFPPPPPPPPPVDLTTSVVQPKAPRPPPDVASPSIEVPVFQEENTDVEYDLGWALWKTLGGGIQGMAYLAIKRDGHENIVDVGYITANLMEQESWLIEDVLDSARWQSCSPQRTKTKGMRSVPQRLDHTRPPFTDELQGQETRIYCVLEDGV